MVWNSRRGIDGLASRGDKVPLRPSTKRIVRGSLEFIIALPKYMILDTPFVWIGAFGIFTNCMEWVWKGNIVS